MSKEQLSEDFAVKILNLERNLRYEKKERVVSYQIAKFGTSIGANIAESIFAESEMDYIHKLAISQKECSETLYWLRVLNRSEYLDSKVFDELYSDANSLLRILTSIVTKMKRKNIF